MVIPMATIVKKDINKFVRELKMHYNDVWKIPKSEYLKKPDFVVVDPKSGKKIKVSYVSLDDGEIISVVYDDLS